MPELSGGRCPRGKGGRRKQRAPTNMMREAQRRLPIRHARPHSEGTRWTPSRAAQFVASPPPPLRSWGPAPGTKRRKTKYSSVRLVRVSARWSKPNVVNRASCQS